MAKAREVPGLHADLPFGDAARATVAVRAEELFEHADGVLDTSDIERVHAMRVATRRLRAVLEIFRPAFDREQYKPVLRDVKALADALGARRDPDVQLEAMQTFAELVPAADRPGIEVFAEQLRAEQAEGNSTLAEALAHVEESDLKGRLEELVTDRELEPEPEPEPEPELEPQPEPEPEPAPLPPPPRFPSEPPADGFAGRQW